MGFIPALFGKTGHRAGVAMGLWLALYAIARAVLESPSLGTGARVLVAVAPVPAFAWFIREFVAGVRGSDELERRIQLEALAVAFPLTVLLVMTLGLVQIAVPLNLDDWSYRHIWPFIWVFYLGGLTIARRRYQ